MVLALAEPGELTVPDEATKKNGNRVEVSDKGYLDCPEALGIYSPPGVFTFSALRFPVALL